MHLLTLIGVLIVIIGFALRVNALLVVTVAGIATGFAGGLNVVAIVSEFGRAFTENRYMGLVWLTLPVIGLLERGGLKERAQELISRIKGATTGRVLLLSLAIRQLTATIGLTSLGGQAQMVRPLIAPRRKRLRKPVSVNCQTRPAIWFAHMPRGWTTSACSSAKTSSSPWVRYCSSMDSWTRTACISRRCTSRSGQFPRPFRCSSSTACG